MVDISVRPSRAARHVDDGDIVLERGGREIGTVLLSGISGNNWTRQRLQRLAAASQVHMDHERLIADLPVGDSDRIMAALPDAEVQFTAKYGGRMFISDDGLAVISRSDMISFTLVDGDLVEHFRVVR